MNKEGEQEERCNDCGSPGDRNIREKKGLDSGNIVEANRDNNSTKLSLVLIASLLVCCALPAILLSTGAGIAAYSFLKGWNLILLIPSVLLLIFGALAFTFYHHRHDQNIDRC